MGLESLSPYLLLGFYYGVLDDSPPDCGDRVQVHVLRSRWSSDWSRKDFRVDLLGTIDAVCGETGLSGHPSVNRHLKKKKSSFVC